MPDPEVFLRAVSFFAPDLPLPMGLLAEIIDTDETELTTALVEDGKLLKLPIGTLLAIQPESLPSATREDAQVVLDAVVKKLEKGFRNHNKVKQLETFHPIGPHMVTLIEKLKPFALVKQWKLYALMAQYLMLVGKAQEACEYFTQAAKYYPEPVSAEDEVFLHLTLQTADAETARGNFELAEMLIRRVLLDETEIHGHPKPLHLVKLAHIAFRCEDYAQAIELYLQAIQLEKETSQDENLVASHWNNLGRVYLASAQLQQAITAFNQAAEIWSQTEATEHHINRSLALKNLALAYQKTQEYTQAQSAIEEAIHLSEAEYGVDHPDIGRDANIYALILQAQGQHEAALAQFRRALRIDTRAFGQLHPEVALTLNNMGALYAEMGNLDKARQSFFDARSILQKCSSEDHPYWQQVLENIAGLEE